MHTFEFIDKSKILAEAYMIIVIFKINQIIFTLTSIADMSHTLFLLYLLYLKSEHINRHIYVNAILEKKNS
jgi:hypothetical protein